MFYRICNHIISGKSKWECGGLFKHTEKKQYRLSSKAFIYRIWGNARDCNESRNSMSTSSYSRQRCVFRYYRLYLDYFFFYMNIKFPYKISLFITGLNNFDKVLKAFRLAKKELGEILSSFEMMDKLSLDVSIETFGLKSPLTTKIDGHDFYVLMETSGSNVNHDEEKLTSFVEKALADDIIEDGTLTSDPTKIKVSIFFSYIYIYIFNYFSFSLFSSFLFGFSYIYILYSKHYF